MYEVIYDYDNGYSLEENICETFKGTWDELQDYIKWLRKHGGYNIDAMSLQ